LKFEEKVSGMLWCQKEKGHKGKHYNEMIGEW
jgi:hypothetical protein